MTKTYKIKLEDKAALLNRLEKAQVDVSNYEITDNKLEGYFLLTLKDPVDINKFQTILKQSPNIDRIRETLRRLVQRELKDL
jgi:cell division protein FtsX